MDIIIYGTQYGAAKKYADVIDMVRGLRMNKGNVHIYVGDILSSDISTPKEAALEIDRQIHNNYHLLYFHFFYFCIHYFLFP